MTDSSGSKTSEIVDVSGGLTDATSVTFTDLALGGYDVSVLRKTDEIWRTMIGGEWVYANRWISEGTSSCTVTTTANSAATGEPTISGTAQVGQTLTADTSGIADADGLTRVTYSYQWLSSRDAEIAGATNSAYTLQASDAGKAIRVRVTFTDDAGNQETLTSAPTDAVLAGGL